MSQPHPLLAADEPSACSVLRENGRSPFLLTCDHASAVVPRRLNSLGLPEEELGRHVAWDIGAAEVTARLAARLDAVAIFQSYSRLVIDCNRPPGSPQSILSLSETTRIPGNEAVSATEALEREREIFRPYHERIRTELDTRRANGRETILVAVHSFTPVFHGQQRPWHAGLLYNRDRRFAEVLLRFLREEPGLTVGDNEPYAVSDQTDYTIPEYGERRGLLHVGIELRQDLVTTQSGQNEWAERLARVLSLSSAALSR